MAAAIFDRRKVIVILFHILFGFILEFK